MSTKVSPSQVMIIFHIRVSRLEEEMDHSFVNLVVKLTEPTI
jgi:hypothetical protein